MKARRSIISSMVAHPRPARFSKIPEWRQRLKRIAAEGAEYFYEGEIAEKIVRCSEKLGGLFTVKDFADHRSDWVEPITANYRGFDIYEMPPTTQGFVALEMLKILEGFDLKNDGSTKRRRAASDDRGEETRVRRPRSSLRRSRFHESAGARSLRDKARGKDAVANSTGSRLRVNTRTCRTGTDTEYVAAADSEGNLVSFIQSNFMGFGSGVVEPETGIILQNRGHLFSLDENHPNCIGPHKRCVHTLMPGMIFKNGKPLRRARFERRPRAAASAGADHFESHRFRHDAAGGDLGAAV